MNLLHVGITNVVQNIRIDFIARVLRYGTDHETIIELSLKFIIEGMKHRNTRLLR